ncbi:RNA polymerase II subunit A C-terminal domain phosphatase SSU72 [Oryza brachyantha]|uniref:RNA polymerase II subunit A C-terminal domain phosphatase SSU72 n=1 Tax=Oryza brachyantha TaxID=4533 RepID=J3NBQ1_ORYBR|nr:RNA polymerase II subunit A C-terminal domain phosphatase SSU72 [Oryza brachyantha]
MEAKRKMRFAMVCSSNMNRSMEAHSLLGRAGLDVASYGTGTQVKLPGPSLHEPNVYDFGTPYNVIYDDLRRKDPDLYKRNGLLPMLKRNTSVKLAPQRWQDNAGDGLFDVIFSFEERVFDLIVDDMHNREQRMLKNALIINMDVKDNHEEAGVGAKLALELCQKLEGAVDDWEEIIDDLIITFEKQHKRKLTYNMAFY